MTFEPTSRLDGRVAVITGGKGAIGFATARRLATLGARIVSIDRSDPEGVQQLLNTLPAVSSGAHFALTASITDSAALKAAAEQVTQRAGRCVGQVATRAGKTSNGRHIHNEAIA